MAYVKWSLILLFWAAVLGFFHYTLPQRDIVRVTDTYEKRIDFGENSIFWANPDTGNDPNVANREIFFIQTRRARGDVMVYRNEDTGWGWPPYFKFDTSNLQAEAADLRSTSGNPQWAVLTHYGWRNEFLSIFPNAISIRAIPTPQTPIGWPWINIVILTLVAATSWAIWVRFRRFKAARLDPVLEDLGDSVDTGRSRLRRWFSG